MARRKKSATKRIYKHYEKTAPKNKVSLFLILGFILASIGRPFYFLFSKIFIALLFLVYLLGHSIFEILKFLDGVIIPSIKRVRLPSFELPKITLSRLQFPLINLPKLNLRLPRIRVRKRFLFPVLFLFFVSLYTWLYILKDLPSPDNLITRQLEVSTKIYDRNGILLYTIYKDKNRTPVELSQVPNYVRLATLAAEDAEFYNHPGISFRGITRALSKNIREGKLQGGSTITQQLVKNALLSSEKTIIRKAREIILSFQVEYYFSKDEILEMYLNEVSFGGTNYGIGQASLVYFGKNIENLSLAEAALLAGLPQSPSKYSPFGSHPELSFSRQREILHLMRVNKFITPDEEEEAIIQKISFAPNKTEILAPHFVMYAKDQLVEAYGEEVVQQGGLSVKTTLDYQIQLLVEKSINEEIVKLKSLNVGNAAVVVLDPKTGEILAMAGSHDYFDFEKDGNVNVTTRPRQPGSSIKIINYAYALSNGLTLSSTVEDTPITFNTPGSSPYTPKNYDNKYRGKISLRSALAESRNIPAVKILASYGVGKMIDLGEKMGITTWGDRSRFGLSLTLGGGEVKLLDLARVYATVANYGVRPQLRSITEVRNYKSKILYSLNRFEMSKIQVLDPRVAYLLIDVLKDNNARSPAFGSSSMLVIPNHSEVAVKTGTSNDLKDNLTVGFNQNYLVAVWVGNNDNTPMSRIASGVTGAAPIWNKIMSGLLSNTASIEWQIPEKMVKSECFSKNEWYLEEKIQVCPKIVEPAPSTTGVPQPHVFIQEIERQNKKRGGKSGQQISSTVRH